MPIGFIDGDDSTISSSNGMVPSGNRPLPEPVLTKIHGAIWRHKASLR